MSYWFDDILAPAVFEFYEFAIFYYAIFVMSSYLILAFISLRAVQRYVQSNTFTDYSSLLKSPITPGIAILAPAYNEAVNIVENIRSLLAVHYSNFEVVVINDGSNDDTLEKAIQAFDLEPIPFVVNYQIETKPVRGVYRSKNKALFNLILIDKENGGKADALNAGLNVTEKDYVTCIDVDCVLDQDAILKLMKPFADQTEVRVIATGGVVRVANSCQVDNGKMKAIHAPTSWVARFQAVEYIRAFLLGRMAWSYLDGLILISGALGVFDKEIAVKCGGYSKKTVGEDMELVVRMRRYMRDNNLDHDVKFVPDPLCWTEAPEQWSALQKQRNRWTRGTMETLKLHRGLFFNPKHRKVGLLSYPYWFFFEWLAPLMEFTGIVITIFLAFMGLINLQFFILMSVLVYSFAICFSALALLVEELAYHSYHSKRDILKLMLAALLEPFIFHPFLIYSAIRGNIDFLRGKKSWDKLQRKGFADIVPQKMPVYGPHEAHSS